MAAESMSKSVDAISQMSSTRKPSFAARVKTQLRRRFTKRGKRDSEPSLHSSSSAFLHDDSANQVVTPSDSKEALKRGQNKADDEQHRHSASDTMSTSSTIVADAELPKGQLKLVSAMLGDGRDGGATGLEGSVAFSLIGSKEAAEGDVLEISDKSMAAGPLEDAQHDAPIEAGVDAPPPDTDESAPKEDAASAALASSIEHIPLVVLEKTSSDVGEVQPLPRRSRSLSKPFSPDGVSESGYPNVLVAGLAALIMCIPLPNVRYSIRALPLSFFVFWFLYQC